MQKESARIQTLIDNDWKEGGPKAAGAKAVGTADAEPVLVFTKFREPLTALKNTELVLLRLGAK